MKETLVKVTNFVNENTMLLIGICAFLILVLIIYLIDNSIKTKKMQKALKEMDTVEDKVVETKEDTVVESNVNDEETPTFDSISLIGDEEEKEEPIVETPVKEELNTIEETPVVNNTPDVPKEKFTNKKSLSEILSKKKESINENDADKTLEETTEFNNTF